MSNKTKHEDDEPEPKSKPKPDTAEVDPMAKPPDSPLNPNLRPEQPHK